MGTKRSLVPVRVVFVWVLQGPAQARDDGCDPAGAHVGAATGARRSNWRHSPEVALD
jgi:hypothetical protein